MSEKQTAELQVPSEGVTLGFVNKVTDALAWKRPVSPSAILRCIQWGADQCIRNIELRETLRKLSNG